MNRLELIRYYENILEDLNNGKNSCDTNFIKMFGMRGVSAAVFQAKASIQDFIGKLKDME
jgi:hypothetical protein